MEVCIILPCWLQKLDQVWANPSPWAISGPWGSSTCSMKSLLFSTRLLLAGDLQVFCFSLVFNPLHIVLDQLIYSMYKCLRHKHSRELQLCPLLQSLHLQIQILSSIAAKNQTLERIVQSCSGCEVVHNYSWSLISVGDLFPSPQMDTEPMDIEIRGSPSETSGHNQKAHLVISGSFGEALQKQVGNYGKSNHRVPWKKNLLLCCQCGLDQDCAPPSTILILKTKWLSIKVISFLKI